MDLSLDFVRKRSIGVCPKCGHTVIIIEHTVSSYKTTSSGKINPFFPFGTSITTYKGYCSNLDCKKEVAVDYDIVGGSFIILDNNPTACKIHNDIEQIKKKYMKEEKNKLDLPTPPEHSWKNSEFVKTEK